MKITFRPIDQWLGSKTEYPARSPFRARYDETLDLLDRELYMLDSDHVVIELDLGEQDIRLDGLPRSTARPNFQGVIISFDSAHGPLRYYTDAFTPWQANLRAIALGLEALRKVDRYGISKRGEQYTGWRALEAPAGNALEAQRLLLEWAGVAPEELETMRPGALSRLARKNAHPDSPGGSNQAFLAVQEAIQALGEERSTP